MDAETTGTKTWKSETQRRRYIDTSKPPRTQTQKLIQAHAYVSERIVRCVQAHGVHVCTDASPINMRFNKCTVLPKRNVKVRLRTTKSGSKHLPKASLETIRNPKNTRTLSDPKNTNLLGLDPHHACRKSSKSELLNTPGQQKQRIYTLWQRTLILVTVWSPQDRLMGSQMKHFWTQLG